MVYLPHPEWTSSLMNRCAHTTSMDEEGTLPWSHPTLYTCRNIQARFNYIQPHPSLYRLHACVTEWAGLCDIIQNVKLDHKIGSMSKQAVAMPLSLYISARWICIMTRHGCFGVVRGHCSCPSVSVSNGREHLCPSTMSKMWNFQHGTMHPQCFS